MTPRSITPYERYGEPVPVADASLREHVFTAADTITLIADRYLDDWRLWPLIAQRNQIVDVRRIQPGATLVIPQKPLEKGRYESG